MKRAAGLLVGLAVVLVAASCGVPDDRRPRIIDAEEAVVDLSPSTPTTGTEATGDDTVRVFFIDRSGELPVLLGVDRTVPSATPVSAFEQLLVGPPEGLASSIPPGTGLQGTSLPEDGTLTIDLAETEGGLLSVAGDVQTEAFAQIVWTMTRLAGVRAVRFVTGGEPVQVPRVGAAPTTEPVDRADYASLAPGQG